LVNGDWDLSFVEWIFEMRESALRTTHASVRVTFFRAQLIVTVGAKVKWCCGVVDFVVAGIDLEGVHHPSKWQVCA
jgi:hypothetical protein